MSSSARHYCFGISLVLIVTRIVAYHFDVDNIILYEDPAKNGSRGSYFGYSVALWNPGETSTSGSWIFVGAPRANSSVYSEVREPGTVFKCRIGKPKSCAEWALNVDFDGKPTSGSWLGGAMGIENKTNPQVLVCGPKWTDKEKYLRDHFRVIPGICYSAKATYSSNLPYTYRNQLAETISFSKKNDRIIQQAGFSMHMVAGSLPLELVFGSPGAYSWHGREIRYRQSQEGVFIPSAFTYTTDGIDYSGYAVTSGKYFKAQERIYATGVPRGADLHGKVNLFEFPSSTYRTIQIHLKLRGHQIGEYFGSALASCDIDGDGRDDLLVGAPHWTKTLDEGRVYTYRGIIQSFNYRFNKEDHFEGEKPGGRFGSAITCLGDIDYDGYADVAVGAPYDGNGAVHIFHGSKNGLIRRQIIDGPKNTRGFGFAISEPRDIDNNGYADIAVGSCLSGHVALIRSKRVIAMTVTISTASAEKSLNLAANSFVVNICSSYKGAYPPQQLNVVLKLKIDELYGRGMIQIDGRNLSTYEFSKTLKSQLRNFCEPFEIKINKGENFNYLEPLTLIVSQHLHKRNNVRREDNFDTLDAVTKDLTTVDNQMEIPFEVKCDRGVCHSNLSIEITTDLKNGSSFVIGTSDLRINVQVKNTRDNAFLATAVIDFPVSIRIVKMPSNCRVISKTNNPTVTQIVCNIGNPLKIHETRNLEFDLDMSKVLIDTADIKFSAVVQTVSDNSASVHSEDHLSIVGVVNADIGIAGKTDVDWSSYMQTQKKEQLPIMTFQHSYEIKNYEATPLAQAVLSISVPTHWSDDGNDIEIVRINETAGELDGAEFYCPSSNETSDTFSSRHDATTVTEWLMAENSSEIIPQTEKKFMSIDGKVFSATPDNRTLYINTTNPLVKWKTIDCIIGPFKTRQSVAKVVLTLNLVLPNFEDKIMRDEDIIFFVTNGSTKITMPLNFTQTINNKPDVIMIGTRFVVSRLLERQVAPWVIGVSIFVGILLLILVILGLFKFGFFNRNKKLELEALMKETEYMPPRVDLQTMEDS